MNPFIRAYKESDKVAPYAIYRAALEGISEFVSYPWRSDH